jgi:FlaA1/EpsC-like NDP-sugar epimerase
VIDARALDAKSLAELATGRDGSLFECDYRKCRPLIEEQLAGARTLLIGGAGSIGSAVARLLAGIPTAALHIVDSDENGLVELTRDMRASGRPVRSSDLRWLPLDFGSEIMRRFLASEMPYDFVLNFAALKHVRSEKDIPSILRMLDTNVVKQDELITTLEEFGGAPAYFAVSTDKAAAPVNLMGASKRLMEHVILGRHGSVVQPRSSARFANVAFSNGSLLHGWIQRVIKGQPIVVPRETRRFFVSVEEAGQICMIAAFCQGHKSILIPRLNPQDDLRLLETIATDFINYIGLTPVIVSDPEEAIGMVSQELSRGRYPILLTELDTTGEKPFEEFLGPGEVAVGIGLESLEAIRYCGMVASSTIMELVARIRMICASYSVEISKDDLVGMVRNALPEFVHSETGKNLDQRV